MSRDIGCRWLQKVQLTLRHKLWRASLAVDICEPGGGTSALRANRLRFRYDFAKKEGRGGLFRPMERSEPGVDAPSPRLDLCANCLDRVCPASRHYTGLGRRSKG